MTRREKRPSTRQTDKGNLFEKMSFEQALSSPEWKQHLEDVRPSAFFARTWVEFGDGSEQDTQRIRFANEAVVDEDAIMQRFRDYLAQQGDSSHSSAIPIPATFLREFLNSLGAVEMSIWNSLPVNRLIRAAQGEIPISLNLSACISNAFGTPTALWAEMQREYDDWRKRAYEG